MKGKEQLRVKLGTLAECGAMPRSNCGVRFMSFIRPLILSGIIAERRLGPGRQLIVQDLSALHSFIRDTFPMESDGVNLPSRVLGVHRFRDSKTYRVDGSDVLRVRAFSPGVFRKNGNSVDVLGATENHGVFSFRLGSEYTLHGCSALIENPTVFDLFERIGLNIPIVIYGQGRISSRALDWLCNQTDPAFSLFHLPDYDPVGLTEFERIRNRIGPRAQLYLPNNLEDLIRRFGNRALLRKPRSQRLLARLRTSKLREVQAVVKLIDFHNAGLEQEALIH